MKSILTSVLLCLLSMHSVLAETINEVSEKVSEEQVGTLHSRISLLQMGRPNGVTLSQGQRQSGMSFTLPSDQVITDAVLNLHLQVSNELAEHDSILTLTLNGQPLSNIPLDSASSIATVYRIKIPAILVTSFNHLNFEIESGDEFLCKPEIIEQYKVSILPLTTIDLVGQQLNVAADLNQFPKPFFDEMQMNASLISVSLSERFTPEQVSAAALISSWLGMESDYRGVSFQVLTNSLPTGNGIVIGSPGDIIDGLTLPQTDQALIKIIANPNAPAHKLLLVVGRNDQQLRSAAWRLIQGGIPTNTSELMVAPQVLPQSQLYDAPRWISTQRPVYLKELIRQDQAMTVDGIWHDALNVSFRAAPDLFLWDGDSIPMKINYRFPSESWIDEEKSFLNMTFNHKFLDDLPMNKQGGLEKVWQMLGGDIRQESVDIPIDPKLVYGDNQLSLYFKVTTKADTLCNDFLNSNAQSQIKEDSWIDFSKTRHFTLLPNLSYFAGSSFPFSRMADYSETTILLPSKPANAHIATLLDMAARSGNDTGTPLVHNRVFFGVPDQGDEALISKDILAISTMDQQHFNGQLLSRSPFDTQAKTLTVRQPTMSEKVIRLIKGDWDLHGVEAERYSSSKQSWRGFVSYRSPWNPERVVVLALASDNQQLIRLNLDLNSSEIASQIHHDMSIITDENGVRSFQVAPQFPSGELPWYMLIIWYANQHSFLLACLGGLICLIAGFTFYNILVSRSKQRLNPEHENGWHNEK
ncbi:cellulose biosynthesis cyclic di-GMP-binding regulatory protein BcsB [Vibrio aphrogenes]|uniref:cellulose biosynthesis cyclic di-GMP-binding regulatory protein BcsB n=1 Tax=Vibrio aphrogenes TaxID=1891186 RepID=UPI000B34D57C|nr:cellulose biosynthesis cyclic di-GMP-binding regulatory protein BcsB [Vibrio aphrogenes]